MTDDSNSEFEGVLSDASLKSNKSSDEKNNGNNINSTSVNVTVDKPAKKRLRPNRRFGGPKKIYKSESNTEI